jgi:serine/threonine protein kinase
METKDFIKKLLVLDVNRRLSAKDALSHPFFETLRRETVKQKKEKRNQMS